MADQEGDEFLNDSLSKMRRDIELQSLKLDDKLNALEKVQNDFIASMVSNIEIRDDQVNAIKQESVETSSKVYAQLYEVTQALVNERVKAEVSEMIFGINTPVKFELRDVGIISETRKRVNSGLDLRKVAI